MEGVLHKFQHLSIPLEEIKSATNNFDDQKNYIGRGGYGRVYKGEASHVGGRSMVAIMRLVRTHGQGEAEFLKEIDTLSRYRHENLISLLGFCYQGDEAILVYELASRGSLDRHLNSPHLTWSQRIKICLGAAKGINYLHDPRGTHQRLIHCDIKGGNILLDDAWNAKVADFGFSISGPANGQQSMVITLAAGTLGYIDPLYRITNTLTKESDVYSFGVVLFEVLCGTLCFTYRVNGDFEKSLVPTWIQSYEQKKLDDIIFKSLSLQPLEQSALEIFSDIAYRCLKGSREDRPKMAEVVTELESALESQELLKSEEFGEWKAQLSYYQEISKFPVPPLYYRSDVELMKLLYKGVLLNEGKTWLSLNKKGEHCEMISFAECVVSGGSEVNPSFNSASNSRSKNYTNSRFVAGTYPVYGCSPYTSYDSDKTHTRVKAQFLSPGITYVVNLVFKFPSDEEVEREDEKQPISDSDLEEKLHVNYEDIMKDSDLEEKLPVDYENIMKRLENSVQWTTKKEAYSILRRGFLIDRKTIWFYLDKNGKKCHMVQARRVGLDGIDQPDLPESRFGKCLLLRLGRSESNKISYYIRPMLVSSHTTYAAYLVYKFYGETPDSQNAPPVVVDDVYTSGNRWYVNLIFPHSCVISQADPELTNRAYIPKQKGFPQQRDDGWTEVQIWQFQTSDMTDYVTDYVVMGLELSYRFTGFELDIIEYYRDKDCWFFPQGIEFRPI